MSQEFRTTILKVCAGVIKAHKLTYEDFCLVGAQCIKETGESKLMQSHFAPLGIKATKSWLDKPGRKCYSAKTNEEYTVGQLTKITACFRAYNSYTEAIEDWVQLMNAKRYKAVLAAHTFEEKAKQIYLCGYATSSTYTEGLLKVYSTYMVEFDAAWNGESLPIKMPEKQEKATTYTVQKGDTLSAIARKFNTNVWNLVVINGPKYPRLQASNGNFILPGWVLRVK